MSSFLHHICMRESLLSSSCADYRLICPIRSSTSTPYSPDLTPCDFFLFAIGKRDFKGHHFESPHVALGAVETVFKHLMRKKFQRVFDEWEKCWAKFVALNDEYLKGTVYSILELLL